MGRLAAICVVMQEKPFLWVALVCKELGDVPVWETQQILDEFPPGLEQLYTRMMEQIWREQRCLHSHRII